MNKISYFIVCAVLTGMTMVPPQAWASSRETAKIDNAIEVIDQIMAIPESGIPQEILESAQGIAIIPGVIKAGFILGGRYGTGVMTIRTADGSWSNPSFISITGGSLGWQVGVQSIDIVLVFKSKRGVENMMRGKFTLGADVGIAAGPVGRRLEAGTDVQLKAEIVSYSRSRGLFAGLSLEGATLQVDDSSNEYFYGEMARSRDIFSDKELTTPPAAQKLKDILKKYATPPAGAKAEAKTEPKTESKPAAAGEGKKE